MNPRRLSLRITTVIALILTLVFLQVQADDGTLSPVIGADNIAQMKAIASLKSGIVSSGPLATTNGFIAGYSEGVVTLLNTRTGETQNLPTNKAIDRLLAVSPDGQYLVYIAPDSYDAILNSTHFDHPITILSKNEYTYELNVGGVAFTPDSSRFLIQTTRDGLSRQWDTQTGKEIFYDSATGIVLRKAVYSPDGSQLLNYSSEAWTVLDAVSGETLLKIPITSSDTAAQYLPDGKTVMFYQPSQIEFWDTRNNQKLSSIPSGGNTASIGFQIAADGKSLAVSDKETNTVSIWSLDALGKPVLLRNFADEHPGKYGKNTFKTNGKMAAIYGQNQNNVQLIDIVTGKTFALSINKRNRPIDVVFSNDGKLIFVDEGYFPREMSVWSLEDGQATQQFTLPGSDLTLSDDGTTLYTSISYQNPKDYRSQTFSVIYAIPSAARPQRPYLMLADVVPKVINVRAEPNTDAAVLRVAGGTVFMQGRDASGKYVYLPDYQGWVRTDAAYLKLYEGFTIEQLVVLNPAEVAAAAPTPTAVSPKPTRTPRPTVVPTVTPGIAQLPTINTTALPETPTAPQGYEPVTLANADQVKLLGVYNIAASDDYEALIVQMSPDSARLFGQSRARSYNVSSTYNIWDLRSLSQIASQKRDAGYCQASIAGISNDGRFIAYYIFDYGSQQNYIIVWDAEKQRQAFQTPNTAYNSGSARVIFNADATLMAERMPSSRIKVWDLETKTLRYETPTGYAFFSKDDQSLVLLDGNLVRVYNAATGKELNNTRFTILENFLAANLSDDANSLILSSSTRFEYVDLKNNTAAVYDSGLRDYSLPHFSFNADNSLMLMTERQGMSHLFDTRTGRQLATWKLKDGSDATFSPDSRFIVTSNPLQFINLADGSVTALPGHYVGTSVAFSADATSLIVGDRFTSMVFGIPNAQRPGWEPVTGHVTSSGISVRAIPDQSANTIGYAKGDVKVGGRQIGGSGAVYLPELGGWVWSINDYLTLDTPFDLLPIISSDPQP